MQLRKRVQDYEIKIVLDADDEVAIDKIMDELAEAIENTSSVELGVIIGDVFSNRDTKGED